SRRRHTRSTRDWSSDVCSSDLYQLSFVSPGDVHCEGTLQGHEADFAQITAQSLGFIGGQVNVSIASGTQIALDGTPISTGFGARSEERRVGKECRSRWRQGG